MVDLNTCPPTPPPGAVGGGTFAGERSKIKSFMGRTPGIGILKSKFLTVLGNSNDLINGISNKLTLSISSSESEYCDDDEEDLPKFDETIDYTKIDYESRRVKARRAHEEIISGRFRHPNLAPKPRLEPSRQKSKRSSSASSSTSTSSSASSHSPTANINKVGSHVSSTTRSNSTESRHSWGYGRPGRAIPGARRSDLDIQKDLVRINELLNNDGMNAPQIDVQPPSSIEREHSTHASRIIHHNTDLHLNIDISPMAATTSANSMRVPARSRTSNSSTVTSLRDDPEMLISPSVESTDWRHFIRSESQNSVPSWASSISLDCRAGEEPIKEFMKRFTDIMFSNAHAIGLELKSEFGAMARLEIGRQWFTRFLFEQKQKAKRVDELTFHSLVQYFAIMLFESGECEDYGPAAILMNLCFVFYHEIEVPGCDAYREYLFTFMRQQPIWHTLRFWNAAFFDAINSEREHRLAAKMKRAERRRKSKTSKHEEEIAQVSATIVKEPKPTQDVQDVDEGSSSSSSSHHSNALIEPKSVAKGSDLHLNSAEKEQQHEMRFQENIVFRQMGAFTCNMHSLGIPQELCLEFMKKQSINFNLSKDKIKLVKDNILRMYHETDLWGAKES